MAQLKDLLVTGPSRLIGDVYANKIQITALSAPTSAGGTTYGLGTDGQVLKSSATGVYWADDSNSDINVTQTITTTSAAYRLLFSNTADDTTRTETARKAAALYYNPATKLLTVSGGQVTATTFNGWLNGTATTATQATHAATANSATTATQATHAATANSATTASYSGTAGYAITAAQASTAGWAVTASRATTAGAATTAAQATHAATANSATTATEATHAATANSATTASNATNANIATKLGSTTIGSNVKPIYLNAGTPTAAEEMIPLYRTAADFTSTTALPGAYYLDGAKNPVTNVNEYGTFLTLPWRKTGDNNYSSQLLLSSSSGVGKVHMYARRNTSTPALGEWTTYLDDGNYTDFTVTKTGTGATGTWEITAGTASNATKIYQPAAISTSNNYPVILGYSSATTALVNTVNKSSTLTYNPSSKTLTVSGGIVSATTFSGYLNGTAATASYAGTAAYAIAVDWANVTNAPTSAEIEFVNWNSV